MKEDTGAAGVGNERRDGGQRQSRLMRRDRCRQRGGNGWRCRQIERAYEERGVSGIDGKRGKTKALKWVGVGKTRGLRWAERWCFVRFGCGGLGGVSAQRELFCGVRGSGRIGKG